MGASQCKCLEPQQQTEADPFKPKFTKSNGYHPKRVSANSSDKETLKNKQINDSEPKQPPPMTHPIQNPSPIAQLGQTQQQQGQKVGNQPKYRVIEKTQSDYELEDVKIECAVKLIEARRYRNLVECNPVTRTATQRKCEIDFDRPVVFKTCNCTKGQGVTRGHDFL